MHKAMHLLGVGRRVGNCIALYGGRGNADAARIDIEGWYRWALGWFEQMHIPPNLIGVQQKEGNRKEMLSFAHGASLLKTEGFSNVTGISLRATRMGGDIESGFSLSALIETSFDAVSVLCFDNDLAAFNAEDIGYLAQEQRSYFDFSYGAGYQRPFEKGPVLYALGIAMGLGHSNEEFSETNRIGKWFNAGRYMREKFPEGVLRRGWLRDIYPENLLTTSHEGIAVAGEPFFEWIVRTKTGSLTRVTDGLWQWSLRIPEMTALRKVGILNFALICEQPEIPPITR
jgi:hypothetical protein